MLNDIVVNLSLGGAADAATEYAISVTASFKAHLTGVAFAYEPAAAESGYGGVALGVVER